jgi:hypothetical protein
MRDKTARREVDLSPARALLLYAKMIELFRGSARAAR